MTNPEAKVKKEVRELLKKQPEMYFNMPVPGGYGESTLDFIGCYQGMFFAIETKAPGKHLTARQELIKTNIEAAGGRVFVIGEEILTDDENVVWWYSGMEDLETWLLRMP